MHLSRCAWVSKHCTAPARVQRDLFLQLGSRFALGSLPGPGVSLRTGNAAELHVPRSRCRSRLPGRWFANRSILSGHFLPCPGAPHTQGSCGCRGKAELLGEIRGKPLCCKRSPRFWASSSLRKTLCMLFKGFPGGIRGKEPHPHHRHRPQCRRLKKHGFDPWVWKIPWRRKWQPPPRIP